VTNAFVYFSAIVEMSCWQNTVF